MKQEDVLIIMDNFCNSTLTRLEYEANGQRLVLEKDGVTTGSVPVANPVNSPPVIKDIEEQKVIVGQKDIKELKFIKAPMVGTFYVAPNPEASPFVEVGSRVKKGEIVCILEAMKMINEIPAPYDCVIEEVLLANGELASFDGDLFRVRES